MRQFAALLLLAVGCTDEGNRIREFKQMTARQASAAAAATAAAPSAFLPAHRFDGPALLGHGRAAARRELGKPVDPDQWKVGNTMLYLIYEGRTCTRIAITFVDSARGIAADHRDEIESWLSLDSPDWRSRVTWDTRVGNLVTASLKGHESP